MSLQTSKKYSICQVLEMLFPLCPFLLSHMHNLNDIPSCLPFRLDLGYLCIEFCMRRSLHDCNRQHRHRLGMHQTVGDVVLHLRFLLRNGGHYTAFFYFTRVPVDNKDFEQLSTLLVTKRRSVRRQNTIIALQSFSVSHAVMGL